MVGVLCEPSSINSGVLLPLLGLVLPGEAEKLGAKPKKEVIKGDLLQKPES